MEANEDNMKKGRFQLRWTPESASSEGGLELIPADDVLHCLNHQQDGQLYFMLGFAAMVLLEMAGPSGKEAGVLEKSYRDAGMRLLDYLTKCVGVFESPLAHKVARGAAMAKNNGTATKIADYFLSLQQGAGHFQDDTDTDALDSVDQTAEIAVW